MRRWRAFRLFLRQALWAPAPEWEAADAQALAAFLSTGTGIRLQRFLRNEIASAHERAAMKATAFDCGWACGYRGLLAWFESLSVPPFESEEAESESGEELQHLAP